MMTLALRKFRLVTNPEIRGKKIESLHGVKFEYDFDYAAQVKKMYFGLYEAFVVRALKRFLDFSQSLNSGCSKMYREPCSEIRLCPSFGKPSKTISRAN